MRSINSNTSSLLQLLHRVDAIAGLFYPCIAFYFILEELEE
jgi:hypothetical protein